MKLKLILVIFLLFLFTIFPKDSLAWDDCPFGNVNDEYPGDCARYIDTDNDGICDHSQPAPEDRIAAKSQTDSTQITNEVVTQNSQAEKKSVRDYNFPIISIILLLTYSFSFVLSRFGKISKIQHRKIWNIILTISFLITVFLGLFLVLRISYGITINLPFNMLFWHVEIGIVFAVVAIFHFLWHWPYYKSFFKK